MMLNRTILFVMILLLGDGLLCAQSNLTVAMLDGEEYVNELSSATRMFFTNDSIVIISNSESTTALLFPIIDVRMLYFIENTVTGTEAVEDCNLLIYPNPVRHSLNVEGIREGDILSIFSMVGTELLRKQYKSGECIDVSWLKSGNYIMRFGKCVVKFTKM